MHKLHQSSILILATILFSTFSLSGCRNPTATKRAFEEVQYAAKEFAKRFPKAGLQPESVIATSILRRSASQELPEAIMKARQIQVARSAYVVVAKDLHSNGNSKSIDDLRRIAFENAALEAKNQGIVLTDSQLNEIADAAASFARAEFQVLISSYSAAANNLLKKANNASLEELKVAALQGASEEAQNQRISLGDAKLQVIAAAAATAVWQKYQQQPEQQSPS